MLTVLLKILSTIGIVLLWILGIVLVLILLLLLTPFRYRAVFRKHGDEIYAEGRVWWLFHFFHLTFDFSRSNGSSAHTLEIYILGIPILRTINRRKKKKNKASVPHSASEARGEPWTEARKRPTVPPGQWKYMPDSDTERASKSIGLEITKAQRPHALARLGAKIGALLSRIRKNLQQLFASASEAGRKIRKVSSEILGWIEYLESESFYRFKELALRQLGAILRHILPRRIDGYLEFGTEDPARTGELLGLFAILYPTLPGDLRVSPDFQEKRLEADVTLRGHILLIILLVRALRIVLNREFRILLHRVKGKKNNAKEERQAA